MAEIGTIIAIIQIADRVIELSRYWIEGVLDAESDLRSILLETSMLKSVLENIQFLSGCSDNLAEILGGLSLSDGPLGHCGGILTELAALIPPEVVDNGKHSLSRKEKMKVMAARLGWPMKRPKAQKLLDELQRYKTAISLSLMTETVQDIKDIKARTNLVFKALTETQRWEFCGWYQQTDPSPLHNRARDQFEEGTCEWILRLPEWSEWLNKKHRCLWIHGIPGAGKTILASYLINQLENHCDDENWGNGSETQLGPTTNCVALYYYCYFANNQSEAAPFLRWITTQLCRSAESIPVSAYNLYKKGREPSLPQLLTALAAMLESFQTVYIVIDAVDESKPRNELLKVLRDLVTDFRFDKIQLLATSREYIDIERVLEDISKPVSMSNDFITEDIRIYVKAALQKESRFKRWSPELVIEVESTLSVRAKGMFRWAICQIDRLQRLKGDIRAVRKVLETLPKTLDETYERIFTEIPDEDRPIVRQCLAWIDFHNKMHKRNIPRTILLQSINSTGGEDGLHYNDEDLRELCGCLITIAMGKPFDFFNNDQLVEVPVVSFAHYTVREFLSSGSISPASPANYFAIGPGSFNDTIRMVFALALKFDGSHINDLVSMRGKTTKRSTKRIGKIVFHYLTESLEPYCAASSIFFVSKSDLESLLTFGSHSDLVDLVLKVLDPTHPHVTTITEFVAWGQKSLQILHDSSTRIIDREYTPFWTLQWEMEPGSSTRDAMLLFVILMYIRDFEPLTRALIDRTEKTLAQLCETPLKFQVARYFDSVTQQDHQYSFHGSAVEFFAQCAHRTQNDSGTMFKLLMDLPGVPPSADRATNILHGYSTIHNHQMEGDEDCHVQNLLKLGADPNGSGYTTTPLQHAIAIFDLGGVELLLDAGAEVNGLGDPRGIMKRYSTRIRGLEDKSPLYICYHNRHSLRNTHHASKRAPIRRNISHLLIRHGAKSLTRQEDGSIVEEPATESKLLRRSYGDDYDEWFSDHSWLDSSDESGDESEDLEDEGED